MGTSLENSLTNFDLDLLLGPPSASDYDYQAQNVGFNGSSHNGLQTQNAETAGSVDQGYHVQTNHENNIKSIGNLTSSEQIFKDQNMGLRGNTDYDYQNIGNELIYSSKVNIEVVNKSDYEALENHYKKLNDDYLSLQSNYETVNADYIAVKKQYAKLASDYSNLHKENKEHAMESLSISGKCETFEKKEVDYLATIKTLNNDYQRSCLELLAQNKQFIQFQSHIEDLMAEISNLKSNIKLEKNISKDSRKMISSLNNSNQTLTEHLCLFACVIEGRRQQDKDCRRLIKKYCKKTTLSSKKSTETDIIENHSIDTGRGSSLAFSDSERSSFNSPAYSSPCSPFSVGVSTPRNEHIKLTRDSFTSPPPTMRTIDMSTSPIAFDVVATSTPSIKTVDAATNTCDEPKTPVRKTRPVHMATSPIKFTNMWIPITKSATLDTATSPIHFAETKTSMTKMNTIDSAVSPIMFPDTRLPVVKTLDTATSPIIFADSKITVKNKTTLDTASSPIMFADTRTTVVNTKSLDTATSPIAFNDINTSVIKPTLKIAISPIEIAKTKTLDIADSPIVSADTRAPVTKSKTLSILRTSTVDSAYAEIPAAVNMAKPSKTKDSSINYNNVKYPEAAKKEELTGGIKHVNPRVLVSSPSMSDSECVNAKSPMHKPKPLQIANSKNMKYLKPIAFVSSSTRPIEDFREKLNEIISKQSNQSQIDLENDLEIKTILSKLRFDWGMISPMSLTPEPEIENNQSENINKQSSRTVEKISHEYDTLAQSLYLSDVENSDDEIDRDDCNISDLPVENPKDLETTLNTLDENIKTTVSESPDSSIVNKNKDHTSHKTSSSKYQKVTNLQKNDKTNTLTRQIKSPQKRILKSLKSRGSKLLTIAPIKSSSQNKQKLAEKSQAEKQDGFGVEVCKKSVRASNDTTKDSKRLSHPSTNTLDSPGAVEIQCIATETLSNNTKVSPLAPTVKSTEFDSTKTICTLKEAQRIHSVSHSPAKSDTDKNVCLSSDIKCDISTAHSDRIPQPSLETPTDINIETNYTYPKPTIKRLSRVKNGISTNLSNLSAKQTESNQISKNKSCHCDTTSSIILNVKTKSKSISQKNKEVTNKIPGETTNDDHNKNDLREFKQNHSSNNWNNSIPSILLQNRNRQTRHCADYSDINMFDDNNVSENKECEITKQRAGEGIPNQDNISSEILAKSPNRQTTAGFSDTNKFDAQKICENKETIEIKKQSAREGKPNQENNSIGSTILSTAGNSDTNMFDVLNVCENRDTSEFTRLCAQESTLNQVNKLNNSLLAKSTNSRKRRCVDDNDNNMNVMKVCETTNYGKDGIPEDWNQNILDRMIYMYGSKGVIHKCPKYGNEVLTKIKKGIKKCVNDMSKPDDYTEALQQLVDELKPHGKEKICFGLQKYLNDPARKSEFIPTTNRNRNGYYIGPSASQTEMALIDVIELLNKSGIDIWDLVLDISEFILFTLEKDSTPCFDVVESVSHFFANFCKYRGETSRLWMFMLNAMYCLSFKAVPVIKHCLDIVPRLIPYAGAYILPAQAPLIRCFVFLLNFYACDDRLKRVDEIRRRLKYDYHYNLQDENETTLLFLLRSSIIHLADRRMDKDMLELSFLIVAKRRGTKWCHKNIVQKILLPMIKGEVEVSYTAKRFCIKTIGCIMKPYNNDMTVHTEEVVNLLIFMFKQESQSDEIKEDIIRSMIYMDIKTLWNRINACLSTWTPPSTASAEFLQALKIYVQGKSLTTWKTWHQYYVVEI